ncbi:hypothetical protein [Nocardia amamiensis]|uniref:hypothetical protein n=1 Tax=Nocardia amamiensis TaxID=404578 RepID=UPI00340EEB9A
MNDEQFERIMALLRDQLPSLADELDQELRLGRAVSVQSLPSPGDYRERAERLADTDLAPLGKADIAMVPYSNDERAALIRRALVTLADTMFRSRDALLKIAAAREMEPTIRFGDPELENPSHIDLSVETALASIARDTVRTLLPDSSAET